MAKTKTLIIGGAGYIGSALGAYLSERGENITSVDLEWFGKAPREYYKNIMCDFADLEAKFFDRFANIILLAGHSSVQMCQNNMHAAFKNNVQNFVELMLKIRKGQKFIYASSSSVYGDTGNQPALETWDRFRPKTYYDLTKQEIDYYAELSNLQYYGLRFGTVNGCSFNTRIDIMINKMFHDAVTNGVIQIFNQHISRPILGIEDLCGAIYAIIQNGDHRGIYNLASFNATVGEIANCVAEKINKSNEIKIENLGNIPSYNFSIETSKFEETYNFKFKETIETIVHSLFGGYDYSNHGIRKQGSYGKYI